MDNVVDMGFWDTQYNRPIVNNRVLNPATNVMEDVSPHHCTSGPPSVDVIWHNMSAESTFHGCRAAFPGPMDNVFVEIGKHVEAGVYKLISVSASAYSVAIICGTEKPKEEVVEAISEMRRRILRDRVLSD